MSPPLLRIADADHPCSFSAAPALPTAETYDSPLQVIPPHPHSSSACPPEYNDLTTMRSILDLMTNAPAILPCRYPRTVIRVSSDARFLGHGGALKGNADAPGTVENGSSSLVKQHVRGYGSEAVARSLECAPPDSEVDKIISETFPELTGSTCVVNRNLFSRENSACEPGVINSRLHRAGQLS